MAIRSTFLAIVTLAIPVLPALAGPFEGIDWAVPAGMQVAEKSAAKCPDHCVVLEGERPRYQSVSPWILLHQPVALPAERAFAAWQAAYEAKTDDPVTVLSTETQGTGESVAHVWTVCRESRCADDEDADASLFIVLQAHGLSFPVELQAHDRFDFGGRAPALSQLISSVKIDADKALAAIRRSKAEAVTQQAARDAAVAKRTRLVDEGYAAGGKAALYFTTEQHMVNRYTFTGLQMQAERNTEALAFLPGGVLVIGVPDNLRHPNFEQLAARDRVGSWTKAANGYLVSLPDVKTQRLNLDSAGRLSWRKSLLLPIAAYSPKQLVGGYASMNSSGGGAGGGDVMVRSHANFALTLGADGRYTRAADSFTAVLSTHVTAGAGKKGSLGGRWTYDPASYMLTLTPDDGSDPLSGPTFCQLCTRSSKDGPTGDWTVLGNQNWWAAHD